MCIYRYIQINLYLCMYYRWWGGVLQYLVPSEQVPIQKVFSIAPLHENLCVCVCVCVCVRTRARARVCI